MPFVVPDTFEIVTLGLMVGKVPIESLILHLFINDITPSESDDVGDYTEANGDGYAAVPLTPINWVFTPGTPASATYPQRTFTFTAPAESVYGYFITRATTGDLVLAERFDTGPASIQNAGDEIKITPKITLRNMP